MTPCYDCEQIGRKSSAERIVKGVQCCDFHYRQRMGIPMLVNQRIPPPMIADIPKPPEKEKEGCPVEQRICKCGCGKTLRKDNTKDFRSGHQAKKDHAIVSTTVSTSTASLRGLDRSDRVAQMAKELSAGNGDGRFTVKLSPAGMNSLWLSLSPEKKAELLGHLV